MSLQDCAETQCQATGKTVELGEVVFLCERWPSVFLQGPQKDSESRNPGNFFYL